MNEPSEIVTFYLANGLTGRILAAHVDDGTGHCAGCAWQQAAQPIHPCALRYSAEIAAKQEEQ
ncbi:hypothetical protein ACU61A_26105 [Pseudonocardia sichuanensis]